MSYFLLLNSIKQLFSFIFYDICVVFILLFISQSLFLARSKEIHTHFSLNSKAKKYLAYFLIYNEHMKYYKISIQIF